jgi:hypothetical protein
MVCGGTALALALSQVDFFCKTNKYIKMKK